MSSATLSVAKQEQSGFAGLAFADMDMAAAVDAMRVASRRPTWHYVVTPNAANLARLGGRDPLLRQLYDNAHLVFLDSKVVFLAARLLGRRPPRVIPGADLVEQLFAHAITQHTPICVVGGSDSAAARIRARFNVGTIHHINPPMGFWRSADEIARTVAFIGASQADYTFLVVGSPGQEMLAAEVTRAGGARGVAICAGASIDFLTGVQKRAPRLVRGLALEWAYRFCQQPRRLAYRYLVESPKGVLFALRRA
jgi:exopolysaccharide biosynthesis WecB/TagA/CpsF family protein